MNFIIRRLVTAIAVGAAVWLVPGIEVLGAEAWVVVALVGLILSLINIRITCLTLGIFYLVVNTAMLYLAAWVAEGIFDVYLHIASFGSAFVAAIVVSIVSAIVNSLIGNENTR